MRQQTEEHLNNPDRTPDQTIKVLYLAGWGRSGTTVMSNILGEVPGFFSPGEIWNLWQRGLVDNRICGCGKPFYECEYWTKALNEAFGDRSQLDVDQIMAAKNKLRNLEILVSLLPGGKQFIDSKLQTFVPFVEKLYRAIQKTSNCRVIVDASKIPINAYILSNIPGIELYMLHVVRHPNAVAYSWMKKAQYDPEQSMFMDRFNPFHSTLIWSARNILIELLWGHNNRYMLLRYEDFIAQPKATLTRVIQHCQENASELPFVSDNVVSLKTNHNVSGNPNRFETGQIQLRLDDQWKTQMQWKDKVLLRAAFLPLLMRYGYSGNR